MSTMQGQIMQGRKRVAGWVLAISLTATVLLISSCTFSRGNKGVITDTPAQQASPDATAEMGFSNQVGTIDDLNRGLTLKRIDLVAMGGFPTPSPNDISVMVLNHTTEPVQFANIGFGIQVFEFQAVAKEWRRVRLPYTPEQKVKVIPPKLETYDFGVLNGWDISPDDLAGVTSNEIRIFVTGNGIITKQKYGAFLDVWLQFGSIHGDASIVF